MPTLCDASRATLIVIDLQERLMPAIDEGATVIRHAVMLAQAAKLLGVPVIGTAQYPAGLGQNVAEVQALCDRVIPKTDFDAGAEPAFLTALHPARDDLVVIGCEAHVCVLLTVLGLLRGKRRIRLVVDAIGSRQPFNKIMAMERAKAAGADLVTTEMVLFEWMRSCTHPRFKEVLQLLK